MNAVATHGPAAAVLLDSAKHNLFGNGGLLGRKCFRAYATELWHLQNNQASPLENTNGGERGKAMVTGVVT